MNPFDEKIALLNKSKDKTFSDIEDVKTNLGIIQNNQTEIEKNQTISMESMKSTLQ